MRDVRFGSKADIVVSSRNVRFTPESKQAFCCSMDQGGGNGASTSVRRDHGYPTTVIHSLVPNCVGDCAFATASSVIA